MEDVYFPISDEELDHSGIKGMRWGVRRYQNKDGTLTPAGKKRYNAEMEKIKAETRKVKNQQRTNAKLDKLEAARKNLENLKKGGKEDSPEEDVETKKARILESRSAKELYDNANLFTTNELNAAYLRLNLERNIKSMQPAEVSKGKAFAQKFTDKANTVADVTQAGSKAYNNVAKIYNAFIGNKNNASLPLINDSVSSKLDKFKEETEWLKAKNERKKAVDESKPKEKSDLDKLREETARIDAENRNREAKRASRAHDEKDAREAAKKSAAQTQKNAYGEPESTRSADKSSQYRSGKSTSETVSSGKFYTEKQLALPAPKASSQQALTGKSYVDQMLALPAPSPQLALPAPTDDD